MEQSGIDRINELTRISRARKLTAEEESERTALRRKYADAVKASLTAHLEHTFVVDEAGNKRKLPKKK